MYAQFECNLKSTWKLLYIIIPLTAGGIESVECSTGMEWWNGIVEWPHFSHLEGNKASLGHIMCLNSIVLHTDSSQGSSAIHLLAATFTGREGSGDFRNCSAKLVVNTDTGIHAGRTSSPTTI